MKNKINFYINLICGILNFAFLLFNIFVNKSFGLTIFSAVCIAWCISWAWFYANRIIKEEEDNAKQ